MSLWIERPAANFRNPTGRGIRRNVYRRWVDTEWADCPIDWIRAANGGYPLGGLPYELGNARRADVFYESNTAR